MSWYSIPISNKLYDTYIKGQLDVSGGNLILRNGDISCNQNIRVGNNLTVYGNLTAYRLYDTTLVNTTVNNYEIIVTDDLSLNGNMSVSNDASIGGHLELAGNINSITPSELATLSDISTSSTIQHQLDSKGSTSDLALKASIIDVDISLALRPLTTVIDSSLALKSNTTYVDASLNLRPLISDTDVSFGLKANTSYVDASLNTRAELSGSNIFTGTNSFNGDVSFNEIIQTADTFRMGGHILPLTDSTYDLGSAEYKIRHLYLSNNSLWIGDTHKIEVDDGNLKFKKRQRNALPAHIANAGGSIAGAIASKAGASVLSDLTLEDLVAYASGLGSAVNGKTGTDITASDIYGGSSDDFEVDIDPNISAIDISFSSIPELTQELTPTRDYQLTTKKYVDDKVTDVNTSIQTQLDSRPTKSIVDVSLELRPLSSVVVDALNLKADIDAVNSALAADRIYTDGSLNTRAEKDGTNTFTGTNSFTTAPTLTSYSVPSSDTTFATKKYVDDNVGAGGGGGGGGASFTAGMIIMWSGAIGSIPSGWVLCDGNNSTPNLSGKFILGYGSGHSKAGTLGNNAEDKITETNIPELEHSMSRINVYDVYHSPNQTTGTWAPGPTPGPPNVAPTNTLPSKGDTNYTGANSAVYNHGTVSGSQTPYYPPYYVLAFIMKS
jgi:hypothetical protein